MKSLFITAATQTLLILANLSATPATAANSIVPPSPACIESDTDKKNCATLAERLCKTYSQIKTVSCEIRKITKGEGHTMRMLSRVHYKYPNHIHVDNVTPVKRTIIADGDKLYYYQERMPKGFSRPISKLTDIWLNSLHSIPGTAQEHLIPLCGIEEATLPAVKKGSIRRGYAVKDIYVVLTADAEKRITSIEFFKTSSMKNKTGEYIYSGWKEVMPTCWISTHYKATLYLPNEKIIRETRNITNLAVNKDIPDNIFDHKIFLKNIRFTDTFKETYE